MGTPLIPRGFLHVLTFRVVSDLLHIGIAEQITIVQSQGWITVQHGFANPTGAPALREKPRFSTGVGVLAKGINRLIVQAIAVTLVNGDGSRVAHTYQIATLRPCTLNVR